MSVRIPALRLVREYNLEFVAHISHLKNVRSVELELLTSGECTSFSPAARFCSDLFNWEVGQWPVHLIRPPALPPSMHFLRMALTSLFNSVLHFLPRPLSFLLWICHVTNSCYVITLPKDKPWLLTPEDLCPNCSTFNQFATNAL